MESFKVLTFVAVVGDLAEVEEVRADDGDAHVVALHELNDGEILRAFEKYYTMGLATGKQ